MWTSIECHLDTNLMIKIDFKSSQDRTDYNFRYMYTLTANDISKSYLMSKNKRLCSRVHYSALLCKITHNAVFSRWQTMKIDSTIFSEKTKTNNNLTSEDIHLTCMD